MPLTDRQIKQAKPSEKPARLFDAGGLYLEVAPSGGRWWRLKYRMAGKEKRLSLGTYPEVTLAQARERRDEARKLLAQGIDPSAERKAKAQAEALTLEVLAREWLASFRAGMTADNAALILHRLERNAFPVLGSRPVREMTAQEVLAAVKRVADRGTVETSHRTLQYIRRVLDYAVLRGYVPYNVAAGLSKALPRPQVKHHGAVTNPRAVAELLRAIDAFQGSFVVSCALRLAPLVFLRPGELRHADWLEIDLEAAEWRIPAERMKMKRPHIVPLSLQAVAILREVFTFTGPVGFVFPSIRTKARPMSENTLTAALRRLGYEAGEMTAHGFRSMASTILHEQGWPTDVIERQLAHVERNSVKAAYNHAEHLPERRKMMQAWADYLEGVKAGAKVMPLYTFGTA